MGDLGYGTNSIINLSTLYLVLWLYLAQIVVFGILYVLKMRKNRVYKYLQDSLFWRNLLIIMM